MFFEGVQVYVTNGNENSPAPYVLITNNIRLSSDIHLNRVTLFCRNIRFVLLEHPGSAESATGVQFGRI
jgi:hypothetical protein